MSYVLKTGAAGEKRLDSVHALYGEESRFLCEAAGLSESACVLDLGCGTGRMTAWFSEKVGENGFILGVDGSDAQLQIASDYLKSSIHSNTKLICKKIEILTQSDLGREVDFIYLRLVLVHNKDPLNLIKHIKTLCSKKTILIIEEPITDASFCCPESLAFNQHLRLYQALGESSGFDFNLGRCLTNLLLSSGFQLQGIRQSQRAFNSELAKLIAYRRTKECADQYLELGLLNQVELDALLLDLKVLADDKSRFVSGVAMTQAWGCFPA